MACSTTRSAFWLAASHPRRRAIVLRSAKSLFSNCSSLSRLSSNKRSVVRLDINPLCTLKTAFPSQSEISGFKLTHYPAALNTGSRIRASPVMQPIKTRHRSSECCARADAMHLKPAWTLDETGAVFRFSIFSRAGKLIPIKRLKTKGENAWFFLQ